MVLHCNNGLCQSILGLSATVPPTTSEPFHKNSETAGPFLRNSRRCRWRASRACCKTVKTEKARPPTLVGKRPLARTNGAELGVATIPMVYNRLGTPNCASVTVTENKIGLQDRDFFVCMAHLYRPSAC